MQRRQATVVFNDISGYTSMMQDNESFAITLRQRHKEVVDRLTRQHNGEIIQYYGDGTLTLFNCSLDAVNCALSMQKEFGQDPQIPLRIGINSGDVLLGPDGIYGDCVNIASRIERMSVPGSILISDEVHRDVSRQSEIRTADLGHFELKNVRQPMHIHAIVSDGIRVPHQKDLEGKIGYKEKAIIVLPFYNLNKDPESDFFSDGITEQIIYALSDIEGLRITSRSSSFAFKDKPVNLRELHQEMGIDHVLEGSVRQHGNKVRITAQLIHAADDFHLWSETYHLEVDDVFQVQDEIALKISNKLKAGFEESTGQQQTMLSDVSPQSEEGARDFYNKGKYYWTQKLPGYVDRANQNFIRAVEIDPNLFPAWAALAKTYLYKGVFNLMPPSMAKEKSLACLNKAHQLSPGHPDAESGWALYHLFYSWDLEQAESCLTHASKAVNGNFIQQYPVLQASGLLALAQSDYEKAIRQLRRALKLNPLNLSIQMDLARTYLNAGELMLALEQVNHMVNTRPDFLQALELKGWILYNLGHKRESIDTFKQFRKVSPSPVAGLAGLSYVYARTLQTKLANEVKSLLSSVAEDMPLYTPHYAQALAHLGAQEYMLMFEQLNAGVKAGMPVMIFLESNPVWDEIRRFKEYSTLTKRITRQT